MYLYRDADNVEIRALINRLMERADKYAELCDNKQDVAYLLKQDITVVLDRMANSHHHIVDIPAGS